jgi:pyruvate/2-oxoglutarate dehydrogenase complex dihydrolipoamide acyltransferase (E2) component
VSKTMEEILTPQVTVNDQLVTVVKFYFKTGDKVNKGDSLLDIHTSKSVETVYSSMDGYVRYLCAPEEEIKIGQHIATIYDSADFIDQGAAPGPQEQKTAGVVTAEQPRFSKPALKRIQELGIDISVFAGRDFVTLEDVEQNRVEVKKLSAAKRTEISYLNQVQQGGLNSCASIFVDTEHIFNFTRDHLKILKFSILPIIIYECARLLKEYKDLNAYYIEEGKAGYYLDVVVGLAIDIDDGLKVVNIPGADHQSLQEIESSINALVGRYKNRTLKAQDLEGSTFTVTDLSFQGVHSFTPLINKKQSAVLGVPAIDFKLNRCSLSLAFDHRVTEGKRAGQFLSALKKRIEIYNKS